MSWSVKEMQRRIAEPLRIAALARGAHLSPSRFAHLFRAETGCAPGEFLQALRMLRARILLQRTFLTVKEVAAMVGCNDPSHFAKDFRRFHGIAPRACRASDQWTPQPGEPSPTGSVLAGSANGRQDSPASHSVERCRQAVASIVNCPSFTGTPSDDTPR